MTNQSKPIIYFVPPVLKLGPLNAHRLQLNIAISFGSDVPSTGLLLHPIGAPCLSTLLRSSKEEKTQFLSVIPISSIGSNRYANSSPLPSAWGKK
ncbi:MULTISPECIES: hypothetical protein [Janthinobacterium]|jgi:hypothetical protein|uniref:hypothetical protein n=1 Tax=Janthinobacterium TaxID=29580 RepID=UPI001113C943|nr:hypothetical protein [Janthinobacterium lividum]MCL6482666.1 hypothetical protein [Janthinobacterium lividum]